ncbi:MAG TPA: tetratricopeptide repeat protein [Candidatus Polarisedimenticolaceae bacterium]|nr:tetratricopeptide repeat protein [Candidatus Polarisedimenticolaceae bacterium]
MRPPRTTAAVAALAVLALGACGSSKKSPEKNPTIEAGKQIRLADSYFRAGRVSESLDIIEKAVASDPKNASLRNFAGQLNFFAGRHAEAEKQFNEALKIDAYMTDARNNLGSLYDATGRKDLAEQEYKKALADTAYPTPEKVHLNLGLLYLSQGRQDEAIAEFRRGVEINPKFWRGHYELASALDKSGKLEEAIREYEVALPDYKSNAEYHYRLGLAYMKDQQPPKAREHLSRCQELAPGSENASKALDLLKMIP